MISEAFWGFSGGRIENKSAYEGRRGGSRTTDMAERRSWRECKIPNTAEHSSWRPSGLRSGNMAKVCKMALKSQDMATRRTSVEQ